MMSNNDVLGVMLVGLLSSGALAGDMTVEETGTAPARKIIVTSPGVYKAVVWQGSGGGINEFYDLCRDPEAKKNLGTPWGLFEVGWHGAPLPKDVKPELAKGDSETSYGNRFWPTPPNDCKILKAEGELEVVEQSAGRIRVRARSWFTFWSRYVDKNMPVTATYTFYPAGQIAVQVRVQKMERRFQWSAEYGPHLHVPASAKNPDADPGYVFSTPKVAAAKDGVFAPAEELVLAASPKLSTALMLTIPVEAHTLFDRHMRHNGRSVNWDRFGYGSNRVVMEPGYDHTWACLIQMGTQGHALVPPLRSSQDALPFALQYRTPAKIEGARLVKDDAGDFNKDGFNESESCHVLKADEQPGGLTFSYRRGAGAGYAPAFKVIGWKGAAPRTVRVDGKEYPAASAVVDGDLVLQILGAFSGEQVRVHLGAVSKSAPGPSAVLEPWASKAHPQDLARRYVEEITAGKQVYRIVQGGTMDGTNCRSPIGGGFGIWDQSWESNRAVRLENIGDTDVVNPWLSNGKNDFRSMAEIVARAVRPGMSDREKAIALWRLQTTHRFHASSGDNEVNDPVKVFNVYGYTTCGNDSICLAGLWQAAGMQVRPARCPGHCISQVFYDGRWHLLDGDMGPFYLLRDNKTIASEYDLVRDHDLVKRSHTGGILDPDSRPVAEAFAGLFVSENEWKGNRNSVRDTTMNMVLRPGESLVWRWGRLTPVKYHGRTDIKVFGPRSGAAGKVWGAYAADRVCNGLWEYRPDFTRDLWRKGTDKIADVESKDGALVPAAGATGTIVWKMRSPYPFVGGRLDTLGSGTKLFFSWNGAEWQDVGDNLEAFFHFPHKGDARYAYWLKCELPAGARLERLAIVNDLQMAPLALPGMVVGENRFTYTDQSAGARSVRITHEWVERSRSRPPAAPPQPVFPADDGQTDGTAIAFQWAAPTSGADRIADYHFELSDRSDLVWPLSANFEKLISNTADQGQARYTLREPGLLTPGTKYYWRVRAKNDQGVWGPWSRTWHFTAGGPAPPADVRLEPAARGNGLVLRWQANPAGRRPATYRVYGSDEKGFSVSDSLHQVNVGQSKELPAQFPANFVAETKETALAVLGAGLDLPNANRAFYRVVAVDDQDQRSGPSDYVAAPRPYIHSEPLEAARVGSAYRSQVATIRSLGDLRMRLAEGKETANYWDIERPRFTLVKGPSWLRLDEKTGMLSGVPDAAGQAEVVVRVSLERTIRRLDDARLSWGHELVKEIVAETVGSATQTFRITVAR